MSLDMVKDIEIVMISTNMNRPSKKIRLSRTYLINQEEIFSNTNNTSAKTVLTLSKDIYEEKTSVFNKNRDIKTLFSNITPIECIDNSDEEDTPVTIDIYIDSQTRDRFREISPNTDIYRIINHYDYDDILSEYTELV